MSFLDDITRAQAKARSTPLGHRSPKHELYALLGECMELARRARFNTQERQQLHRLVREDNRHNKKGRWVEAETDTYLLVCRFVFYDPARVGSERTAAWRYATVLRQAGLRQIKPAELGEFLRDNGGMASLVLTRPVEAKEISAKTLRLDRAVTVAKGAAITLTLRHRQEDNTFEVVDAA